MNTIKALRAVFQQEGRGTGIVTQGAEAAVFYDCPTDEELLSLSNFIKNNVDWLESEL
jgi:hypothetical protein